MENRTFLGGFFGASSRESEKLSANSQQVFTQPSWAEGKVDWVEIVLSTDELLPTERSPSLIMFTFMTVICDVSELSSVHRLSPESSFKLSLEHRCKSLELSAKISAVSSSEFPSEFSTELLSEFSLEPEADY